MFRYWLGIIALGALLWLLFAATKGITVTVDGQAHTFKIEAGK